MTVRKPLAFLLVLALVPLLVRAALPSPPGQTVFGYADFSKQAKIEEKLKVLTEASAKMSERIYAKKASEGQQGGQQGSNVLVLSFSGRN